MEHIEEVLDQKRKEYGGLIYLIEDFSHRFNMHIKDFAFYLTINNFSQYASSYIRINKTDYLKLDSSSSEKSIRYLLDLLNNNTYSSTLLPSDFNDDIDEFDHICIREDDLYEFPPLKDLELDYRIGNELVGTVNLKNINYRALQKVEGEYWKAQPEIFTEEWYSKHPKLNELRKIPMEEPTIRCEHPSLNAKNPNHAPELLLAIQVWEDLYIHNQYPHHEHTPAIKNILKKKGYSNLRLLDRISAITNPNKNNKKQ